MGHGQADRFIEVPRIVDQDQVDFYVENAIWPCLTCLARMSWPS